MTTVGRLTFVRPPSQIGFPEDVLLRIDRSLYGIPEAGIHWFLTYHGHQEKEFGMNDSVHDKCILNTPGKLSTEVVATFMERGITALQTDDEAYCGNKAFINWEGKESRNFD